MLILHMGGDGFQTTDTKEVLSPATLLEHEVAHGVRHHQDSSKKWKSR